MSILTASRECYRNKRKHFSSYNKVNLKNIERNPKPKSTTENEKHKNLTSQK